MKRKRLIGPTDARGSFDEVKDWGHHNPEVRAGARSLVAWRGLSPSFGKGAALLYTRLAPPGAGRSLPAALGRDRTASARAIPRGPPWGSGARRAPLAPPPSTSGLASSASPSGVARGSRDGPGASGAPRLLASVSSGGAGPFPEPPRRGAPGDADADPSRPAPSARGATRRPRPRRRRSWRRLRGRRSAADATGRKGTTSSSSSREAATDRARGVAETATRRRRDEAAPPSLRLASPSPSPSPTPAPSPSSRTSRASSSSSSAPLPRAPPIGSTDLDAPLANTPSRAGASSGSSPKRRTRRDEDAGISFRGRSARRERPPSS